MERRRPGSEAVEHLDAVVEWLLGARGAYLFTGAGISTESGIPDFRGPNGLWRNRDPMRYTLQNFVRDAEIRRESWENRVNSPVDAAEPNAGHRAVAALERAGLVRTVVTQNIDGLHQRAGSSDVIELHGTTREAGCLACGRRMPVEVVLDRFREGDLDPHCEVCGGLLKTATISFGQALVERDIDRALEVARASEMCIAAGSTLSVWPAAGVPLETARRGGRLVIVNDSPTELDDAAAAVVRGRCGEVLTRLVAAVAGGPAPTDPGGDVEPG